MLKVFTDLENDTSLVMEEASGGEDEVEGRAGGRFVARDGKAGVGRAGSVGAPVIEVAMAGTGLCDAREGLAHLGLRGLPTTAQKARALWIQMR